MTKIKKLLPLFIMAIIATACQKAPDMEQLSTDLMVYTHYDNQCDFSQYKTFYIPDSLLKIDTRYTEPQYYSTSDPRARQIVEAVVSEMSAKGYRQVADRNQADLGIILTYIKNTHEYVGYVYPYWWDYYYWPMDYWDPFYIDWYPYYPYSVGYSYTVGSLVTEMIALKDADKETKQLPFVWTSVLAGIETSNQINIANAVAGIYQAFEQSPYINSNAQ